MFGFFVRLLVLSSFIFVFGSSGSGVWCGCRSFRCCAVFHVGVLSSVGVCFVVRMGLGLGGVFLLLFFIFIL